MPHKRAKFSERVADKERRGRDLPPDKDAHFQSLPKGAMRIINGAQIQANYNSKKKDRARQEVRRIGKKEERNPLQIRKGERLPDFHRRVESAMAKDIQSSIRATTRASKKQAKPSKLAQGDGEGKGSQIVYRQGVEQVSTKNRKRQRESIDDQSASDQDWQKAEIRRRISDVVKEPPMLTKAPRGESDEARRRKATLQAMLLGKGNDDQSGTPKSVRLPDPIKKGGLRREAMLKEERARVIQAYRLSKEKTNKLHSE